MNKIQRGCHLLVTEGPTTVFQQAFRSLVRGPLLPQYIKYRSFKYKFYHGYNAVDYPASAIWLSPHEIQHLTAPDYENDHIRNPEDLLYVRGLSEDHPDYMYVQRASFQANKHIGSVMDGTWDHPKNEFTDLHVYKAIRERFTEDIPWEDTKYFQLVSEWMDNGHIVRDCTTPSEYLELLEQTEKLYEQIAENGYKSQEELNGRMTLHEIGVNIGRNGGFLYNSEGHHRLSIAKVLDVEKVAVVVIARHKRWQKIREEIYSSERYEDLSDDAKRHLDNCHPDLRDLQGK